jgi:hypothetical protein
VNETPVGECYISACAPRLYISPRRTTEESVDSTLTAGGGVMTGWGAPFVCVSVVVTAGQET